MREHEDCEDAANQALARGRDGYAEFILTRCDMEHGNLTAHDPTTRVQPVRAAIAAREEDDCG